MGKNPVRVWEEGGGKQTDEGRSKNSELANEFADWAQTCGGPKKGQKEKTTTPCLN